MALMTVKLTRRRPVRFESDQWPALVEVTHDHGTVTEYACVRQHVTDGRILVYVTKTPPYPGQGGYAGEYMEERDWGQKCICVAIEQSCALCDCDDLVDEVLEALPPEDI